MHPSVLKMKTTRLNSHRRAKMQDNRAQIIQATCRVVNFSVFIAGRQHLSGDDTSRCPSNSTRISVSIKDIVLAATRNQFISCKLTEIKERFEGELCKPLASSPRLSLFLSAELPLEFGRVVKTSGQRPRPQIMATILSSAAAATPALHRSSQLLRRQNIGS